MKRVTKQIFGTRDRSRSVSTDPLKQSAPARQPSPTQPMPGLVRRFSLLNAGSISPRRQSPTASVQTALPTQSLTTSSSFEKLANASAPIPRRRQSSDMSLASRPRSPSASASNIGSKLVQFLSRSGSQRSQRRLVQPVARRRASVEDVPPCQSMETFESGSSEGVGRYQAWEPRHRDQPLNHHSKEEFQDVEEEVDWHETLSDDEDYDPPQTLRPGPVEASWNPHNSPRSERADSPLRSTRENREALDDDDGLAISIGSRRGRKSSLRL